MHKLIFAAVMSSLILYSCNAKDTDSVNDTLPRQTNVETSVSLPAESETDFVTEGIIQYETHSEKETKISSSAESQKETASENTEISETTKISDSTEITEKSTAKYAPSEDENFNPPVSSSDIKTICKSQSISEKCEWVIAEYFRTMGRCDSKKYLSYLPPVYKEYFLEYLESENYTVDSILKKNYENISQKYGGDFSYSCITMEELTEAKRKEYELPDYAESYLEQLDEISEEKYGYDISEKFTECFSVICTADIKINESGQEISVGDTIITVFKYENEYYIIMA